MPPCSPRVLSEDSAALGRAIRELRARRNLSQEALRFEVGTHRNYIGSIERGETNPTFSLLMRLSNGLALPLSTLIKVYERQRSIPPQPSVAEHEVLADAGDGDEETASEARPDRRALLQDGETRNDRAQVCNSPPATRPATRQPAPGGMPDAHGPFATGSNRAVSAETVALGLAIAEVCRLQGLNRSTVAQRLGVSPGAVAAIERGEEDVRFGLLTSLADSLTVEVADLIAVYGRHRERIALVAA
jgi:transcriptional regulator with XRE-family HTH domain